MRFNPTELAGAWVIEPDLICDDRGAFARTWCVHEFAERGLNSKVVQCNISLNHRRGTLRGMHFQLPPHSEAKLVRCTQGGIFDVIVDIRTNSPSYRQWQGFELTAANRRSLYIPEGFAHGFQTLEDDTEVFYQMSNEQQAASASGVRWNDPAIAINWPLPVSVISERDQNWPVLS